MFGPFSKMNKTLNLPRGLIVPLFPMSRRNATDSLIIKNMGWFNEVYSHFHTRTQVLDYIKCLKTLRWHGKIFNWLRLWKLINLILLPSPTSMERFCELTGLFLSSQTKSKLLDRIVQCALVAVRLCSEIETNLKSPRTFQCSLIWPID